MLKIAFAGRIVGVMTLVLGVAWLSGCAANQQAQGDGGVEVVVEGKEGQGVATSPEHAGVAEAAMPARSHDVDPKVAELSAQLERIRKLARFAGQLEAARQYAQQPDAPEAQVQAAMEAGAKAQETLRLRQIELFLMEQEAQLRNINEGWYDLRPTQRPSDAMPQDTREAEVEAGP